MNLSTRVLTLLKKFSQQHPRAYASITLFIKVGLTAFALRLVFTQINWRTAVHLAQHVPGQYLVIGTLLYIFSKIVSAVRLQKVLQVHGIELPGKVNLRLYFQGMFYNLFLPGGVGGDAYKAMIIHQKTAQPLRSVIVGLLLDRISGVVALLVLALLFFMMIDFPLPVIYRVAGGAALVLAIPAWLGFLYLFFKPSLPVFTPSLVLSLAVQCLQVLQAWVLLAGLQVGEAWFAWALVFLLSSLATLIPVTVGGLGARELVFVFAARYLGISQEIAVTFSLLFFLINAACSLPGIFLRDSQSKPK